MSGFTPPHAKGVESAINGIVRPAEAEKLITAGRVFVNERKITQLGSKADPFQDKIRVGKRKIKPIQQKVYYIFNKPHNVMTTRFDPEGRHTIFDYLEQIKERVYPVGRLDFNSREIPTLTRAWKSSRPTRMGSDPWYECSKAGGSPQMSRKSDHPTAPAPGSAPRPM